MSLASINLWLAMGWNVLQVMRIIWSQKESSHGWGFLALGKEICLVLLNQKESHYLLHWRKRLNSLEKPQFLRLYNKDLNLQS